MQIYLFLQTSYNVLSNLYTFNDKVLNSFYLRFMTALELKKIENTFKKSLTQK